MEKLAELRNKHLLFDTNVLISVVKNTTCYNEFFNIIEELKIKSAIDCTIKFEFLRGASTKGDLEKKYSYLDILLGEEDRLELFVDKETFENAIEISNLYARKKPSLTKQISFGDCLIAAQMKKYNNGGSNNLFLATIDNNDFPLFLFDRISIHTIDTEEKIINVGIYSFNNDKYNELKRNFN